MSDQDAMSDDPPSTPRNTDYKPHRKTADDGRITVTLKYKIDRQARKAFKHPNDDAVNCLRQMVEQYERGDVSLAHLVAQACEIEVAAAK